MGNFNDSINHFNSNTANSTHFNTLTAAAGRPYGDGRRDSNIDHNVYFNSLSGMDDNPHGNDLSPGHDDNVTKFSEISAAHSNYLSAGGGDLKFNPNYPPAMENHLRLKLLDII